MKASLIFALALAAFATATEQKSDLPDFALSIDLEDIEREINGTSLVARKQVEVCETANFQARPVNAQPRNKRAFASTMASIIYDRSRQQDCTLLDGRGFDISYRYFVDGNSKTHCDTTAEKLTIQGALNKALALPGKAAIWPTMCLRLKHGGKWTAYLSLGHTDVYNNNLQCGPGLEFASQDCVSGGKKDARSTVNKAIEDPGSISAPKAKDRAVFPDTWFSYDLASFDGTSSLEARKPDQVCTAKSTYFSNVTNFLVSVNTIKGFITSIASLMKSKSDDEDCAVTSGAFAGIAFRYYATGDGNSDCATTSELGTIEGALWHHFQEVHANGIPESECLKFSHDGKWKGWLLYGPSDTVDLSRYCGDRLNFGDCTKGGKKDNF